MCQASGPASDTEPLTQEDRLVLRGGLHGRLAEEFCILQCEVDALVRCVEREDAQTARATLLSVLEEMMPRIRRLERLSDNAADLALGTLLRRQRQMVPLDLVWHIQDFCQIANEELAACGSALRVQVKAPVGRLWIETDERLVDGILANLFSNAAAIGAHTVTLTISEAQTLLYADDGPGPSAAVQALLRDGTLEKGLLAQGGTGLLIVREYADAIHWSLFLPPETGAGLRLGFRLPSPPEDRESLVLRDDSVERDLRSRRQRAMLQREFAAL